MPALGTKCGRSRGSAEPGAMSDRAPGVNSCRRYALASMRGLSRARTASTAPCGAYTGRGGGGAGAGAPAPERGGGGGARGGVPGVVDQANPRVLAEVAAPGLARGGQGPTPAENGQSHDRGP